MEDNKWISVKKELPPKFKNALFYSKSGRFVITCVDSSGKIDEFELEADRDKYTHWMPLPSPPKQIKEL